MTIGHDLPELASTDPHLNEETLDVGDIELDLMEKEIEKPVTKEIKIPSPTIKPPVLKAPPKVHNLPFLSHCPYIV